MSYFNDWYEACKYANECWPPYLDLDPFPAFAVIAYTCFMIWFLNEVRLSRRRRDSNDA